MEAACVVRTSGARARVSMHPDADLALVGASVLSICAQRGCSVADVLKALSNMRGSDVQEVPAPYILEMSNDE